MTLKLVHSDKRGVDEDVTQPGHIVAFETYMLQQSIARIMELARLYPEIVLTNMLALSECFAAFAKFYGDLSRRT